MKTYLLFLPTICIVYIVILVIKKSDTTINLIPSKEFTQVTSLDNIGASNLLPIEQQTYISKPYSTLNFGLELLNKKPENYIDDLITSWYEVKKVN